MSCKSMFTFAAPLVLAMAAAPAYAHALLQKAVPAVGATVAASPREIRLKFSEGVEPHFCGVELATADGKTVPTGKPAVDPADGSVLTVSVPEPLKPGVYSVNWRAVSVDTHKTQGSFTFTVAP
jgi:copper resistance protein C